MNTPTGSESKIVCDEKPEVASRAGARHVDARGGRVPRVVVELEIAWGR